MTSAGVKNAVGRNRTGLQTGSRNTVKMTRVTCSIKVGQKKILAFHLRFCESLRWQTGSTRALGLLSPFPVDQGQRVDISAQSDCTFYESVSEEMKSSNSLVV